MSRPPSSKEIDPASLPGTLTGGGEMGALMRRIDWSRTAVGPVEQWPQSLCTALSILLETGFPMYIAWGPDFTQFYNDGYRPILGSTKHPLAMGISTRETFAEIWDIIGPMFEGVMRGTPVTVTDFLLPLDRHGFVEECYFVFSYSPIRAETRQVGGVLVTVTETTERVLAARRLVTLQDLVSRAQRAATEDEACQVAADVLGNSAADVPFALLYRIDDAGESAVLAASTHLPPGTPLSPSVIDLRATDAAWPLASVAATREPALIPCPATALASLLPAGSTAPEQVFALPIVTPGSEKASGVLLAALSPRLLFDAKYQSFLELCAAHVGSAIASARALKEARERALALAEIDRVKTAFFSNVSHELRTPLTLMLGPAEDALAGDALTPVERERWSIVQRSALRLSKLVNTLLDFSRIEAGRVEASFEPVDLGAFTRELSSMFRSAVDRGGLALRLHIPEFDEQAYVDRDMWEKIVLNLLSNALKFTFEGAIELTLRIDGTDFELVVADTGIGIPDSELPHIFERFHRVKGARARTQEGTGIGLALVAELVHLHGGTVHAEAEGRGTRVRVRVPRGRAHLPGKLGTPRKLPSTATGAAPFVEEALRWMPTSSPSAPRVTSIDAGAQSPSEATPRERILLADDNADMRDYLARLLRDRWDVEAVGDGDSALAAIQRTRPDLVLSDVMMPGLDGFALLRAVRGDPALRLTPIVLLSARAGEEASAEGLAAGANDYIVKPFSARELLVRVASTLTAARVAREMHGLEEAQRANLYRHFMQAPFPIAVFKGPRHVVEMANPQTLSAWGKGPDVIGKALEDGLPELRGQPFLGLLDGVFRTGATYHGKEELAHMPTGPDGAMEDAYFNFVYAPLRDSRGDVEGVLLSAFLVSDQVRARRELELAVARAETSEANLRELVENLPELAWNARPDGHIDFFNRRWYEFTGTTKEAMEGWGWQSMHHPDMLATVISRWKESLATGQMFEAEFPLRRADGVYRWFLTRAIPLRNAQGQIVRWFGTNTDVDDLRRERERSVKLAAELSVSAQRLQTAQRAARIGIFDWDVAVQKVVWSPELFGLMGLSPGALEPTPDAWTAALVEQDRDVGWSAFRDAIASRAAIMEVDVRLRQPAGEGRWVRLSTQIDYDASGAPTRLLGAAVDIQSLKEAQREAEAAEKAQRTVLEFQERFVAVLGHDLRNPLGAIEMGVGLLRQRAVQASDEATLRIVSRLASSSLRAKRMVEQILDLSRSRVGGGLTVDPSPMDLSAMLTAVVEELRAANPSRAIEVSAPPLPGTWDRDRLEQVFSNLVGNAVHHGSAEEPVTVTAHDDGSVVCVDIHNGGPPIPDELRAALFSPFRRGERDSRVAKTAGLGLGLFISRELVAAHGGDIDARSSAEEGTTFRVTLPRTAEIPLHSRKTES